LHECKELKDENRLLAIKSNKIQFEKEYLKERLKNALS
jgi:hypothetical protein